MCQKEEVVGRVRPCPQTMWHVEFKVSTRFSNKEVRGGCERLASRVWWAKARLREVGGEEVGKASADTPG